MSTKAVIARAMAERDEVLEVIYDLELPSKLEEVLVSEIQAYSFEEDALLDYGDYLYDLKKDEELYD